LRFILVRRLEFYRSQARKGVFSKKLHQNAIVGGGFNGMLLLGKKHWFQTISVGFCGNMRYHIPEKKQDTENVCAVPKKKWKSAVLLHKLY